MVISCKNCFPHAHLSGTALRLQAQPPHLLPSLFRARLTNPRPAFASPLGVLVVIALFLALISPWLVGISQVHTDVNFGFQNPICWLVVLTLVASMLATNTTIRLATLLAAEATLVGWFVWVMWLATTPTYASVDFSFVGIDLVGPGWFEAALGLFATGAVLARSLHAHEIPPARDVWLLAAVPGMGLMRIGRTARGVIWSVLVATAVFLASVASPIAPIFEPISGHFDLPAAPPTRAPEWILLGAALVLAAASLVDTLIVARRQTQVL